MSVSRMWNYFELYFSGATTPRPGHQPPGSCDVRPTLPCYY